eukprot:COSAG02_NODE_4386_length_5421_cov_4.810973_3_plen_209_part_00
MNSDSYGVERSSAVLLADQIRRLLYRLLRGQDEHFPMVSGNGCEENSEIAPSLIVRNECSGFRVSEEASRVCVCDLSATCQRGSGWLSWRSLCAIGAKEGNAFIEWLNEASPLHVSNVHMYRTIFTVCLLYTMWLEGETERVIDGHGRAKEFLTLDIRVRAVVGRNAAGCCADPKCCPLAGVARRGARRREEQLFGTKGCTIFPGSTL